MHTVPTAEQLAAAEACVNKGIARLMRLKRTRDWHKRVRLNNFDPQDILECVLAQLYGSYEKGLIAENMTYRQAGEEGFAMGEYPVTWPALDTAWRRKIVAARSLEDSKIK